MVLVKEENRLPEVPSWWMGSIPEYLVFNALLKLGYKNRFTYQSAQMGGRLAKGGVVIDFEIPELNLAINVQSSYYHYATTPLRVRGALQKAQLESMGMTVIFIDENDILRDALYYVREAIRGIDHSMFGR